MGAGSSRNDEPPAHRSLNCRVATVRPVSLRCHPTKHFKQPPSSSAIPAGGGVRERMPLLDPDHLGGLRRAAAALLCAAAGRHGAAAHLLRAPLGLRGAGWARPRGGVRGGRPSLFLRAPGRPKRPPRPAGPHPPGPPAALVAGQPPAVPALVPRPGGRAAAVPRAAGGGRDGAASRAGSAGGGAAGTRPAAGAGAAAAGPQQQLRQQARVGGRGVPTSLLRGRGGDARAAGAAPGLAAQGWLPATTLAAESVP